MIEISAYAKLAREDEQRLASSLADAFFTEPLFSHALPNKRGRRHRLRWLIRNLIIYTARAGILWADRAMNGGALWLGPEHPFPNVAALAFSGMVWAPLFFGIRGLARMSRAQAVWEGLHRQAPLRHFYLFMLGVRPEEQGQGLGSALMAPVLERADREGIVCVLDTCKERNLPLYKRNGFEVVSHGVIDRVFPYWTMRRNPKGVG